MRKIYIIEGLDCPNCAKMVENHLNNVEGIEKATVDFVGKKLFISFIGEEIKLEELEKEILSVEDGIKLLDPEVSNNQKNNKSHKVSLETIVLRLVFSSVVLAFAHFWELKDTVRLILFIFSYLLAGYDILINMIKNIIKGRIFTEFTLMGVATIGALILKENVEAVVIMILYQVGELLQDAAVDKSRLLIKETIDLRPKTATVVNEDGTLKSLNPSELRIDDIIDVKVGEMIPVDCILLSGEGTIDMSSLTGESLPIKLEENQQLLSGTTLTSGHLTARVIKKYNDSTASKILDLIETNGEKKSKAEKFVTKFASIYTPVVFALAFIIGVIIPLFNGKWDEFVYKALVLLVASCPCSLVISIPLTYFVGMGELARKGIIVKGANYLDSLRKTKTIVTDKTGTLTKGKFIVAEINVKDIEEDEFILCVAHAESISNHPLAISILDYYNGGIDHHLISEKEEIPGLGVKVTYKNKKVVVGGLKLVKTASRVEKEAASVVYVEIDGQYVGYIVLKDKIKESTYSFVKSAHSQLLKVVMLTGDKKEYAISVANELNIDTTYFELLPEDKVLVIENIIGKEENKNVIYIGDGINDAPSLARADVGIAMGAIGSDSAIETADIVIMNDNLNSVTSSIGVANKIYKTSIFNIVFSLSFKLVVYILTLCNISSMWMALVADVGVTLLLVLHSLRLKNRIKI